MALGGYKFAGYKVTKPEGATDTQWAELIHKARLKAFWDANTASGAGWVFDKNSGHMDWNGGPGVGGDVIYCADGDDDLNLVSFFRHGTGADAKYYIIATLFNWEQYSGTITGRMKISNGAVMPMLLGEIVNRYKVDGKTLFHAVGYSEFPDECLSNSSGNYPQDALPLIPIGGWAEYNNSANSFTGSEKFKDANALYLGYAVKGTNIITFATRTDTLGLSTNYRYTKNSFVGFDSLKLSSPNDSANIYGVTLNARGTEIGVTYWFDSVLSTEQETLKDDFNRYPANVTNNDNALMLTLTRNAVFNGNPQLYPFENVGLTTNAKRVSAPYLNSDGITSKGTFDIDLLACNGTNTYTGFSTWKPVANGNYLTAIIRQAQASDTLNQTTYYIGWDPSNPDITQESSWPEYSEY